MVGDCGADGTDVVGWQGATAPDWINPSRLEAGAASFYYPEEGSELAERGLEGFVYAFGTPVTESAKALVVSTSGSRYGKHVNFGCYCVSC